MEISFEKLLQLVLEKNASELNLTVGVPPSVRLRGTLRPLNCSPLTPDDTLRFMRVIAPPRHQQELKEQGRCEFGFPYENNSHFFVTALMLAGHCRIRLQLVPKQPRL